MIRILVGDVRSRLRDIPDGSVQCVVTSPPYFGLRDYGTASWDGGDPACDHGPRKMGNANKGNVREVLDGDRQRCYRCGAVRIDQQIGLEGTLQDYIATLVEVFRDVRRVLRDDGTVWIVLGDSYCGSARGNAPTDWSTSGLHGASTSARYRDTLASGTARKQDTTNAGSGLKQKDLMMVPARVAIALVDDGWYLRSDIIWAKRNPMPESVQGSQYVRHRVTIDEYERLSGLRYTGERHGQAWAGHVSDVQACEIPGSKAQVSAEREGQGNGASSGRTRGCAGETPPVQPFSAGPEEQSEIRIDREGQGDTSEGDSPVSSERQGENQSRGILSANQERSTAESSSGSGKCEIRQVGSHESQEAARVREAPASDRAGSSSNGDGLARDRATAQASLPLLRGSNDVDSGSRDTPEQRRAARQGKPRASVPELQFSEEQQTHSTLLVDCPGCPKCEANDGYILRWNAGRPTSSHEHIFLLTKQSRYFYDAEAVREALEPSTVVRDKSPRGRKQNGGGSWESMNGIAHTLELGDMASNPAGRNQRNVWHLATEPNPLFHFATYPTEIPRRCIAAGTSECGQCAACGAPWVRVVEREGYNGNGRADASVYTGSAYANPQSAPRGPNRDFGEPTTQTTGWQPTCSCDTDVVPQVVLDPFLGSGTTLLVADQLGRNGVGIELNQEYSEMARKRITNDAPMFVKVETT